MEKKPKKKKPASPKLKKSDIRVEKRNAKHTFTEAEKRDLGSQLAQEIQAKNHLEEEKKVAMQQWSNKIKTAQAQINQLADKYGTGFEFRETECEVRYHWKEGTKDIHRLSDKKFLETEKITADERQQNLFEEERAKAARFHSGTAKEGKKKKESKPGLVKTDEALEGKSQSAKADKPESELGLG